VADDTDRERAPWSALITVARVSELHAAGLQKYGGRGGPSDPEDCIDAALGAAYSAELYTVGKRHATTGLAFSGFLIFYLAKRHCFTDGNKRVAWMSAMDVLAQHALSVRATTEEAKQIIDDIMDRKINSGAEVTAWLAPRLYVKP
jgi:death-on-curing protein